MSGHLHILALWLLLEQKPTKHTDACQQDKINLSLICLCASEDRATDEQPAGSLCCKLQNNRACRAHYSIQPLCHLWWCVWEHVCSIPSSLPGWTVMQALSRHLQRPLCKQRAVLLNAWKGGSILYHLKKLHQTVLQVGKQMKQYNCVTIINCFLLDLGVVLIPP